MYSQDDSHIRMDPSVQKRIELETAVAVAAAVVVVGVEVQT